MPEDQVPKDWRERKAQRHVHWSRVTGFKLGRKIGDWSKQDDAGASGGAGGGGGSDEDEEEQVQTGVHVLLPAVRNLLCAWVLYPRLEARVACTMPWCNMCRACAVQ